MRVINSSDIIPIVRDLFIEANNTLPTDAVDLIKSSYTKESNPLGKKIIGRIIENLDTAREINVPICQDTGMAVLFADIGCDVHINGNFTDAVNEGVRRAYIEGYLRCSIVDDPLFNRKNTNDNTPAVIHINYVCGDQIKLTAAPKGFGSENMSAVKMFTPSATRDDIIKFVADSVNNAGSNPCPPIMVGVGIGGNFEYCTYLAKKALTRSVSERNPHPDYAKMESDMLDEINKLNIGPQGFGGDVTAMCVNIEHFPTHIAGLPVAVNINCHVMRHKEAII